MEGDLPQVLAIAAAGAGLYAVYRVARRLTQSQRSAADDTATADAPRDLGVLKRDAATGEYRPE